MPRPEIPAGAKVTYRQQYRRCGKTGCSCRASGARGHGPYWYAFWWEDGRQRSRYLGKRIPGQDSVVADDVQGAPTLPLPATQLEALRVRTLGGFAVWRGATPIPPEAWSSRRAAALFTCLLGAPGHRLQREQAIELLWPEADPVAGATNLRTTIHLLRQVLDTPGAGVSHLRTEGTALALAPGGEAAPDEEWLDATAFARAAQRALAGQDAAACRAALARYGGEYLPDDPYAPWAEQPRAALRRQQLELLLHLAGLSAVLGELEEAEDCLRRVLAAEPSHERAAATLMGLLAASGRRHEALRVYQALATVLEEELEVAPSAEVAALRARLLAQEAAPVAASVPPRQDQALRLTNLPVALTSFVGRMWEVTVVMQALAEARLVTLTGPGGCGKTRLALVAADRLVEAYPDGVWLVELAALADPAWVPRAVAGALGVVEQPGRPALDTLRDFLRPRQLLLVLDNCEHLIAACAELATTLLQTAPHLRILATSREGLAVAGERTYLVPSLTVPDPEYLPPPERLRAYEAVQLFLERARSRRPDLALTRANASAVAQICARLDGLPLAIELAAARAGALPIEAIAARLDDRFRLLTGGPRTALPRQQTLRATLDWSYALLDEPERVLLRRLAVFAGGWTLEAAEAVCSGGEITADAVLDLVAGLVHKSLVLLVQDRAGVSDAPAPETSGTAHPTAVGMVAAIRPQSEAVFAEARYRLLETVRQYSQEQLAAAGELATVRDRHLDWCIALGEQAEPHLQAPQQLAWLDRLEREHDNLRASLQWSSEHSSAAVAGVRLAGAIWRLWSLRGYPHEGRRWLGNVLTRAASAPPPLLARALIGAVTLAYLQGDYAQSKAYGEECLMIYREVGDKEGMARVLLTMGWQEGDIERAQALGEESLALARAAGAPLAMACAFHLLGNVAMGGCDLAQAQGYLDEGLALGRGCGDREALASLLHDVGQVALRRGAYKRADAVYSECLSLRRELGNPFGIASALHMVGETAYCRGDTGRAEVALEESVRLCRDMGYNEHLAQALATSGRIAWQQGDHSGATALLKEGLLASRAVGGRYEEAGMLTTLGHIALAQGDNRRATTLHRESLIIHRGTWSPFDSVDSLEGLAMTRGAHGQAAEAAWLLGAAEAARERFGMPLPPPDRAAYDRYVAASRDALGEEEWAAARAAGRATPLEAAIARALEGDG